VNAEVAFVTRPAAKVTEWNEMGIDGLDIPTSYTSSTEMEEPP
jgi:hypothetical protein